MADSTLVSMLADLHLARARQELGYDGSAGMRDSILARYGVTARQYRRFAGYYAEHPGEYTEIYQRVLDRVTMLQDSARRPKEQVPDSTAGRGDAE